MFRGFFVDGFAVERQRTRKGHGIGVLGVVEHAERALDGLSRTEGPVPLTAENGARFIGVPLLLAALGS